MKEYLKKIDWLELGLILVVWALLLLVIRYFFINVGC